MEELEKKGKALGLRVHGSAWGRRQHAGALTPVGSAVIVKQTKGF